MVNHLQRKLLLALLSTVTLVSDACCCCCAFQNNEIRKRTFGRLVLRSSSAEDKVSTRTAAAAATAGPRGEARRRQQQPEGRSSSRRTQSSQRRQASSSFREEAIVRTAATSRSLQTFDGKTLANEQTPNEHTAPAFDLFANLLEDHGKQSSIRCMSDFENGQTLMKGSVVAQQRPAFEFLSLDDLIFSHDVNGKQQLPYKLPGFSKRFNTDATFRRSLRQALRLDIYDTTPQYYANLSPKAKEMLLQPDSSLQGSWRKPNNEIPSAEIRMKRLTQVLREAFGAKGDSHGKENNNIGDDDDDEAITRFCCPTGDDLMQAIGNLCGPAPSTHFIDIVGVLDRRIPHSWHQDTARSATNSTRTVLWGFPANDDYTGCGVFSHLVSLLHECLAPASHPKMQPILFAGAIDEQYIVRPSYRPGRELLMYRDVDVLHSSPDVAYRTSVMRFM
jgi:hypothetical protein